MRKALFLATLLSLSTATFTQAAQPFPKPAPSSALENTLMLAQVSDPVIDAYLLRVRIYRLQKNYPAALADLAAAIQRAPERPTLYEVRADVYRQQGNLTDAIADVTTLIQLQPEYAAQRYIERGKLHLAMNEPQQALADYDEAVRVAPVITTYTDTRFAAHDAYIQRALLRIQLGDDAGAIADYTQALQAAPSGSAFDGAISSDLIWADLYFKRAEVKARVGDRVGAIQDYQAAIEYYGTRALTNYIAQAEERIRQLQ